MFKVVTRSTVLLRGVSAAALSTKVSPWSVLETAPPDKILALTQMFKDDNHPQKINLGAGTYRDDNNQPMVLECVKKADEYIKSMDHEYAPIDGLQPFIKSSMELVYGPNNEMLTKHNKHFAAAQVLSGTGGLRVVFEMLALVASKREAVSQSAGSACRDVYLPSPTWPNHPQIAMRAGLVPKCYRYYDAHTSTLDIEGMLEDLSNMPRGSNVLLHVCAHNPTGMDPTCEQWVRIADVVQSMGHDVTFDSAYQGFATGDVDGDSYPIRLFVEREINFQLIQSYAKNFGLYGERVGCVSVLTDSAAEAAVITSHLKGSVIRPMYSSPPLYGARLVHAILSQHELKKLWLVECRGMADRIHAMRTLLKNTLDQLEGVSCNDSRWEHIIKQVGMFCYSGLSPQQVEKLRTDHHIYCTADGRISMAGVNTSNVEYLAKSIHAVKM